MALYLLQVAYTSDAWATQIKDTRNRIDDLRAMIADTDINILDAWYAFGEYDLILLMEAPGNADAASAAIAAAAGGAVKSMKTTVLMSVDEGIDAMRKAGGLGYRPPGGD